MKTLAVRLDDDLHARLSLLSKLSGASVTDTIRSAIERHLVSMAADPTITARAQQLTTEMDEAVAQQRRALADLLGGSGDAPKTSARGVRGGVNG